jgi:hypothetical protein
MAQHYDRTLFGGDTLPFWWEEVWWDHFSESTMMNYAVHLFSVAPDKKYVEGFVADSLRTARRELRGHGVFVKTRNDLAFAFLCSLVHPAPPIFELTGDELIEATRITMKSPALPWARVVEMVKGGFDVDTDLLSSLLVSDGVA